MSQTGKASFKRSKPSYFMSILGVTLVLLLLGIIGWLVINANKLGQHFKENVEVSVYIRENLNPKDSLALVDYVAAKPYIREYTYTNKEAAKKRFMGDNNSEDWDKVLTENPLPNSIDLRLKKEYMNADSLAAIKADLEQQTYVTEVYYPKALVENLNSNIRRISFILLGIAILLAVVVVSRSLVSSHG